MPRKIIKIGTSAGVTLPKETLRALNVRVGTPVSLETNLQAGEIVVRVQAKRRPVIDAEVYRVGKRLIERYRPAFEALAKK